MAQLGKVAVIGDLHGSWDDWDVAYFNDSDYDLLLFTGDLGSGTGAAGVAVARSIARLAKRALVMPGNNDVQCQPAIAAEFVHQRGLIELLGAGPRGRSRREATVVADDPMAWQAGFGFRRRRGYGGFQPETTQQAVNPGTRKDSTI